MKRISPLIQYYGGTRDLNKFYHEFRQKVLSVSNNNDRGAIYLSLNGQHHKFRQMATYFLPDRAIASDWMDDGYIYGGLPKERRTQAVNMGDCVVESTQDRFYLKGGATIGPFTVGWFDGCRKYKIKNTIGAYGRESDGANWWHWVESKVSFQLQQMPNGKTFYKTKVRFEYSTRGFQTLTVNLFALNGTSRQFLIESKGNEIGTFETTVNFSPSELSELSIETNGNPSHISEKDSRCAAWMIRNLTIDVDSE